MSEDLQRKPITSGIRRYLIYAGVLKMRPDLFVMFVPPLVLSVVFGILFARWTRPGVD